MNASFHINNRSSIAHSLNGAVLVASAYALVQSSNDAAHAFIQEANFLWLTGIEEAGWVAIIDGSRGKTTLVSPALSDTARIFDGGLSASDAMAISGADSVISKDEFEPFLRDLRRKHALIYTVHDTTSYDFVPNPAPRELQQLLSRLFPTVELCNDVFAKHRARKQPEEIAAIKKAVKLTVQSFEKVRMSMMEYSHEYEIEATFGYEFRRHNARHAYDPIVARGKNACTLHYGKNDAKLKNGQMVLLDVGARVNGYAADITRTYAKGSPTRRQAQIHAAVESAHHDIINLLKPGLSVREYMIQVDGRMKHALREVGLLNDLEDDKTYRRYFPHAISHGLGIDVHDSLGSPQSFEQDMVLTVEPGIYIPEENIGVRIEDDILITPTGHVNLSAALSTGLA